MNSRTVTITKTIIAALLFLSVIFTASDIYAATVRLNKGTPVKLKFDTATKISSGILVEGDSLDIILVEPIIVDDAIIVEAGAKGKAAVAEVKKNGRAGKPGFIKVQFVSIEAKGAFQTEGGVPIMLSGDIEKNGKGKKTLSYLFIFGLFIKGSNGEIDKNITYTAETAETLKMISE